MTATPTPPLISVVIPTRDRADLLRACLDRLAPGAQTLDASQYEVIVSDDGPPGSAAAALVTSHPWVRTVEGPRHGPGPNRNAGAAAARGTWIAFTDDDTHPSREWLAAFTRAMQGDVHVLEGRTTCEAGFGSPLFHAPINETGGRLWSCNLAVRADTFRALGGFDEAFVYPHMEDQDFRERLIRAGETIRFVREAVVDHPPRRQPSGRRLGAYRESEVLYLYKHGAPRPVRAQLLETIVRYRIGVIRSTPASLDSLRALWSLAQELWVVIGAVDGWEAKYAARYPTGRAA
jgi:GT2 family glycosyltransferase